MVIPVKMGSKWDEPYCYTSFLLSERLLASARRGIQGDITDILTWRDRTESLRRIRWLEFTRQSTRKKRTVRREHWRSIEALLAYCRILIGSPEWEAGGDSSERIRGNIIWCSHWMENNSFYHQPDWKSHNSWNITKSTQKGLAWVVGIFSPQL